MSAAPQPSRNNGPGKKAKKTMSIGEVLTALKAEFPDVAVSKIRYLESEGLVTPQRSASGYRRFVHEDVDRLRFILRAQRDQYLPLKVIREQLEALDSGAVTQMKLASDFRAPVLTRLTAEDIMEMAEVSEEFLAQLVKDGTIRADYSGFFSADDVVVVKSCAALQAYGLDQRHFKSVVNSAARQAALITQVTTPTARAKDVDAQQRAQDMATTMSAELTALHAHLLKIALREQLGF